MIDIAQNLIIIILVFVGFVYTLYTKDIIGIAFMCLGIWIMQLMHEVE